jgi:hypothetical protein
MNEPREAFKQRTESGGRKMEAAETKTAVVVMEAGAPWPSYSRELAGRASSAVIESQPASESIDEFASRVVERVQRLNARKCEVPIAIIATSARTDPEMMSARYRMARALLGILVQQGRGELLFCVDDEVSEDSRHGLLAFAGALRDGLDGSDLSVRVRFAAGAAAKSGVRHMLARASGPELDAPTGT